MGIVAEKLLQTIVASAVIHAINGFTYDVLILYLKSTLHCVIILKTGIARTAIVTMMEDKDSYQYEERDTMNKQMKSGSTSLLYEDVDIKNKQTNRDSSSQQTDEEREQHLETRRQQ